MPLRLRTVKLGLRTYILLIVASTFVRYRPALVYRRLTFRV